MSETLRQGVEALANAYRNQGPRGQIAARDLRALLAATAPTPDEVGLVGHEVVYSYFCTCPEGTGELDPGAVDCPEHGEEAAADARGSLLPASQPTSGPEDQRGADGWGEA